VPVDLALFADAAYGHTAFEVRSLADLRAFHQRVLGRAVPVKMALNGIRAGRCPNKKPFVRPLP
jgi:hypothetical protein